MDAATQLLEAAQDGVLNEVQRLLSEGTDVTIRDETTGNTVLHCAAWSGNKELVDYIARMPEVNPSTENHQKETALDIARSRRCWIKIGESVLRRAKNYKKDDLANYTPPSAAARNLTFVEATLENDFKYQLLPEERNSLLTFMAIPWTSLHRKPSICVRLREDGILKLTLIYDQENLYFSECTLEEQLASGDCTIEVSITRCSEFDEEAAFKTIGNSDTECPIIYSKADTPDTDANSTSSSGDQCKTTDESVTCREMNVKTPDPDLFVLLIVYYLKRASEKWSSETKKPKTNNTIIKNIGAELERIEKEGFICLRYGRKRFANILFEIERTNMKVKFCIQTLQELTRCTSFTKKACVILFWFLETFALEDTYPVIRIEEGDVDELKRMKKNYFLRFYPKGKAPQGKCFRCIKNFRNFLIHNTRMIEPHDFNRIVVLHDVPLANFFEDLNSFANIVQGNIRGTSIDDSDKVSENICKYFGRFERNRDIDKDLTASTTFDDVLRRFSQFVACIVVQKIIDPEDVLFDLYFNINPKLETRTLESKRLVELRKVAAHAFHEVSLADLKRQLSYAVPELYRQCLSEEIYKVMCDLEVDDVRDVYELLYGALQTVTEKFEMYEYMKLQPLFEEERLLGMSGHQTIQKERSRWPDSSKVNKYLKYMAPLLDCRDQKTPEYRDETTYSVVQVSHKDVELLEIFEAFINLEDALCHGDTEPQQRCLIKCLQGDFDMSRDEAENVVNVILSKNVTVPEELTRDVDNTLKTLRNIFHSKKLEEHKIPDQHVISLYKSYMEDTSKFSFENQPTQLKLLKDEEKEIIRKTLSELRTENARLCQIEFGGKKKKVNVFSIVVNLMKLSLQEYCWHQVGFETVEEAFNDDAFVSFLINHDVKLNDCGISEVRDSNLVLKNIIEINKLRFTSPYVASLIIRVQNAKSVQYEILEKIVKILLQNERHLDKFVALLNVKDKKVKKAIMNTVPCVDIPAEKLHVILRTLADGQVLQECFQEWFGLIESKSIPRHADWLRRFFITANKVVREMERQHNFQAALAMISDVEKFEKNLILHELFKEDLGIIAARLVVKAHVMISEGFWWKTYDKNKARGRNRNIQLNTVALQCLRGVPEDTPEEEYMLYLSCRSHILGILIANDQERKHAEEAYKVKIQNWNMLWQYISGENSDPPSFLEVYERAQRSSCYLSLLERGPEYRYLDVSRMHNSMLKYRYFVLWDSPSKTAIEDLLRLLPQWKELRDIRKKEAAETDDEFKLLLSILTLRESAKVHKAVADLYQFRQNGYMARFHLYKMVEMNLIRYEACEDLFGRCDNNTQNCLVDLGIGVPYYYGKSKDWQHWGRQQQAARGTFHHRGGRGDQPSASVTSRGQPSRRRAGRGRGRGVAGRGKAHDAAN